MKKTMMIIKIYISDLDMFGLGELPKAYNKVKANN